LSVVDDGVGFAMDEVGSGRFGLVGMRERAERIGGEMEMVSAPGSGTALRLRVPVAA
jgi:signal transduction histidine kinase